MKISFLLYSLGVCVPPSHPSFRRVAGLQHTTQNEEGLVGPDDVQGYRTCANNLRKQLAQWGSIARNFHEFKFSVENFGGRFQIIFVFWRSSKGPHM